VRSEVVYHRFFPNVLHDSRLLQWLDAAGHRWLPRFLKRLCCVHYNFVGHRNVGGAAAGAHPASLS
jgi:hypothetical protein